MFKFQTLDVWKKSVDFADLMIAIAEDLPNRYQYSFGDQLRRAGLSVPNNIAEGNGRKSSKESKNFYNISKGSVYECVNILVILNKRKLIDWNKFDRGLIYELGEVVAKMLSGLIRSTY
jgi:four helix bundle protein